MSYRWYLKILSAFILVIIIAVIPSDFYLGSKLKQFLMHQEVDELRLELNLASRMISDYLNTHPKEIAKTQNLAVRIGNDLLKRVTIISQDGRVWGDSGLSPGTPDKMEDHSKRPEILMARARGFGQSIRFSTTLKTNTLYGAVPIYQKNQIFGFVRLAVPLSQVEDLVSGLRRNLLLAGALTGVLAILLSLFLTWSINRPLREITGMMKKMAEGDLKQPFHLLPKTEFRDLSFSLEYMATQLIEKIGLLDIETNQTAALLSTMREGVLITDEKGRVLLMNAFLQEVLGGKVAWKKKTIQEIFMNMEFQEAVESALKSDTFKRLQLVYGRNPQYHFEVQVVGFTPAQRPRRAVALFHDITRLQYLLNVRQDFVANASHELRTPLTSISGYVETLLSLVPPEPPEVQRFLSIIQKNVKQMNSVISDLLDLAKLDVQERQENKLEWVPVKEVLETASQMIKEPTDQKKINFSENWDSLSENLSALWEKDRIVQALFNVLDNAVKYTPQGGNVTLTAKPVQCLMFNFQRRDEFDELQTPETEHNVDCVELSITDTGIGIPKEHLDRIFERFYRVDKARSREMGGTGLGLAIVKHIIETHGGTIQVQSRINQGSTFTLILPLNKGFLTA